MTAISEIAFFLQVRVQDYLLTSIYCFIQYFEKIISVSEIFNLTV